MTLVNQNFYITYSVSYKISLNLSQMSHPLHSSIYWTVSPFIPLLLLPFMHPVTCAEQVACVVSTSMLVNSWRCGKPWHNCVFIDTDELQLGIHGLSVALARLFFSVTMKCVKHPCTLIQWYFLVGDSPNENTGMWVVGCDILDDGKPWTSVIHLDSIVHLAHLLPIYGDKWAPKGVKYMDSLDMFEEFCVTKLTDSHAFEIAF